jgi:hypothetical protein
MLKALCSSFADGKKKKWEPVPNKVIKDHLLKNTIHEEGFAVLNLLSDVQVDALLELYHKTHRLFNDGGGGMFYGLYSMDLEYRKRVHIEIQQIIAPILEDHFIDFKNVVNFFITKLPGPKSELNIHQDMTSLDENKYSPLSIWIPLHDVHEQNGALCLVPKSHRFFSPYRGISFETPYGNITPDILPYLRPIPLKKGQALLFDPRLLHHSLPNMSSEPRIAIVAGVFPLEAQIITCFKDPDPKAEIELLLQPEEFLLTNTNFYLHCTDRPMTGEKIASVGKPMPPLTGKNFVKLCQEAGVLPYEGDLPFLKTPCQMIGEPVS